MAVGDGADEAEALVDLWTTLVDRKEPAEAITFVGDALVARSVVGAITSDKMASPWHP
jgi:hypothetical protein